MSIKENLELLSKIEDVVEAELKKGFIDTTATSGQADHSDTAHNPKVRAVAENYAKQKGIKLEHPTEKTKVDPQHAAKIAQAYHSMPHDPNHPDVKAAYGALINETKDQFQHMKNAGLKITPIKPGQTNPYPNSKAMHDDVKHNNHLYFFPTEQGFGSGDTTPTDHPMLQPTGEHVNGHHLMANDLFRVVHDYFGHAKEGTGFGPHGEESAWKEHSKMFSPLAQKALTTETRGQNSWVNFGPHGESNRKNPNQTVYAEQKAGLLPDWAHKPVSGLGKSEEYGELEKGSFQRRNKAQVSPQELENTKKWVNATNTVTEVPSKEAKEARENLQQPPEMLNRLKQRLSKETHLRKHPETGEILALLHRGMSHEEHDATRDGLNINHDHATSWTASKQIANRFGGDYGGGSKRVVSAWVPISKITAAPYLIPAKTAGYSRDDIFQNAPRSEKEIIVGPDHNSLVTHANFEPKKDTIGQKVKDFKFDKQNRSMIQNQSNKLAASEIVSSDINKGSLQRRHKFNPKAPENKMTTAQQRVWTHDEEPEARDSLQPMDNTAKLRSLRKLASQTHVRKHPQTGENLYLMHRGMGKEELYGQNHNGKTAHAAGERTSWTPDKSVADSFGDPMTETISAWIPESNLIHNPNQFNAPTDRALDEAKMLPKSGKNHTKGSRSVTEREEKEWIVEHDKHGFHHANLDALAPNKVDTKINAKWNESHGDKSKYKPKHLETVMGGKYADPKDTERNVNLKYGGDSQFLKQKKLAASEKEIIITVFDFDNIELLKALPTKVGERHPDSTKPWVAKVHPDGNLYWHGDENQAAKIDNQINDPKLINSFLSKVPESHRATAKALISHVQKHPNRHFIPTTEGGNQQLRARHLLDLMKYGKNVKISTEDPNRLTIERDSHSTVKQYEPIQIHYKNKGIKNEKGTGNVGTGTSKSVPELRPTGNPKLGGGDVSIKKNRTQDSTSSEKSVGNRVGLNLKKQEDEAPEAPKKSKGAKQEEEKVGEALSNLATDKQTTAGMNSRIYSMPSAEKMKRSKMAGKTGQIPSSINIYGAHYPVVRLMDDNKTLLVHTSPYGQDGKTEELIEKIGMQLPEHFPDAHVIEIHHPDYRHSARIMKMRNPNTIAEYLKHASENHPDENYRKHAAEAHLHLTNLNKIKKGEFTKPIHAKRTASEGFDYEKNVKGRVDRLHNYLTSLGLTPDVQDDESGRDLGSKSPTSLTINRQGDPHDQQVLHEAGHALLTPPGMGLPEYQSRIGAPGFLGKLKQTQTSGELKPMHGGGMPEQTAQHMEGGIARRAGIEPFRTPKRGKPGTSEELAREHAKQTLSDLDQGFYRFDPFSGEKELQATPDTLINAKSHKDSGLFGKIRRQLIEQRKTKASMSKEDLEDMAASEKVEGDIKKGSLQRKTPFNPSKDVEYEHASKIAHWQEGDGDREVVPSIGRVNENARTRAIHKLHSQTEVRKHPQTGERLFLMHRGMGENENSDIHSRNRTSWTPHLHIAEDFADSNTLHDLKRKVVSQGKVMSAWIPESQIHNIPKQLGSLDSGGSDSHNDYRDEHEVIVKPHDFIYAKKQKLKPSQIVDKKINQKQEISSGQKRNLRMDSTNKKIDKINKIPIREDKLAASEKDVSKPFGQHPRNWYKDKKSQEKRKIIAEKDRQKTGAKKPLDAALDKLKEINKSETPKPLKTGDRIAHKVHGAGTVRQSHGDGHYTVGFDNSKDTSLNYKGLKVHSNDFNKPQIKKSSVASSPVVPEQLETDLQKPFKSKKQRKFAYANPEKFGGKKGIKEWESKTPKDIPDEIQKWEGKALKSGALALALAHGAHYMNQENVDAAKAPASREVAAAPIDPAQRARETGRAQADADVAQIMQRNFVKHNPYKPSHVAMKETIKSNPDLMNKYGYALKMSKPALSELVQSHPTMGQEVGENYYSKLNEEFGGDNEKIDHAWRNGIKATKIKFGLENQ